MTRNSSKKTRSAKKKKSNIVEIPPSPRIIVAVDEEGEILAYEVVRYTRGKVETYYKRLSKIENDFAERCRKESVNCTIHSSTGESIDTFVRLFPEAVSSSSTSTTSTSTTSTSSTSTSSTSTSTSSTSTSSTSTSSPSTSSTSKSSTSKSSTSKSST